MTKANLWGLLRLLLHNIENMLADTARELFNGAIWDKRGNIYKILLASLVTSYSTKYSSSSAPCLFLNWKGSLAFVIFLQ